MASIFPFAALRPTPDAAAAVAAVPYDVVNTNEARALADLGPRHARRSLEQGTQVEDPRRLALAARPGAQLLDDAAGAVGAGARLAQRVGDRVRRQRPRGLGPEHVILQHEVLRVRPVVRDLLARVVAHDVGLPLRAGLRLAARVEGRMLLAPVADLIERVRESAQRHAALGLDAVARAVSPKIRGVALRALQRLPATTAERLRDYRSQNLADWVMYREALAGAAESRGWSVHWYDAKTVLDAASISVGVSESFDSLFLNARRSLGAPWGKDHRVAMAAAIVAAHEHRRVEG